MSTKTECPSKSWERYYDSQESAFSWERYYDSQESAEAEVIHEWIVGEIEHTRHGIGKKGGRDYVIRDHFKPKDGWPEDPSEIADEITNLVCNHAALVEVIMLLSKANYRRV